MGNHNSRRSNTNMTTASNTAADNGKKDEPSVVANSSATIVDSAKTGKDVAAESSVEIDDNFTAGGGIITADGVEADHIETVNNGVTVEDNATSDSVVPGENGIAAIGNGSVEDGTTVENHVPIEDVKTVDGEVPAKEVETINGHVPVKEVEAVSGHVPVEEAKAINGNAVIENGTTIDGDVTTDKAGLVVTSSDVKKPLLVLTAPPVQGHTSPLLRLAGDMTTRGFEVIFMSTLAFKDAIERTGAEFYESKTPFASMDYFKSRGSIPPGLPTLMADMENLFIKQMAPRSVEFGSLLELVRERDPSREVVIITETMSLAPMPFLYGAPLPKGYTKFPKTINVNSVPIMLLSTDTGITGPCLPPDASESGRARNKLLNEMLVRGPFGGTDKVFHEALKNLGCTYLPKVFFQNAWLDSYDTTFQLCVPSLEYPRSDLHRSIRFSGALPKRDLDPKFQYPSWWSEIKSNAKLDVAERKKIVAVAQGTVALEYDDLLLPTIKALAKRPDVIVIAILGVKGASLQNSEDFQVPTNARVIDHLPYDVALEHADIFVTNGGYGGLSHGVLNGVPMILSGLSEDKAEVCARGAYAGFAINLRAQRPTTEQVYEACVKIFTEPSFKARALRLMDENEDLDCVSIIERQITKYAKAS